MKVLFFGLGSIGQRYRRLMTDNFDLDIFALRTSKFDWWRENIGFRNEYYRLLPASKNIWSWDEVDRIKPDVAIITNPTHLHIDTAIKCAERGMHVFITKPLDCGLNNLTYLTNLISAKKLTSYIASPLRHLPVVQELKKKKYYNTTWQFTCLTNLSKWRTYKTYSSEYAKGGGVLLELSHELDLAVYLLGDVLKISGFTFNLGNSTDAEDIAHVTMHHKSKNISYHNLSLVCDTDERYFEFEHDRYDVIVDDSVFLAELRYFFDLIGKPIMNNVSEASKLFEPLMEFRDLTHRRVIP